MNENKLNIIEKLINDKKINEAQIELSKLSSVFLKNSDPNFDNSTWAISIFLSLINLLM